MTGQLHRQPDQFRFLIGDTMTYTISSDDKKLFSFSDLTITSLDAAFNLLRNGWAHHRLDRKQSASLLLLDERRRACGVIDLPLKTRTETPCDARKLIALAARENAYSLLLAQNKKYGVVVPDRQDKRFITSMQDAAESEGLSLFDCFLINRLGYYSYTENEYRICPSPYL